jgi:hypothetical protein
MNKKKLTKKLTILSTTNGWKVLTITGIALLASSVYLGNAQAQSFTNSGSLSPKAEALGQEDGKQVSSSITQLLAVVVAFVCS